MGRNTVPVVLPVLVQSSSFIPEILRSHVGKTLFMKQLGALSNEAWVVNIPYIYISKDDMDDIKWDHSERYTVYN